jgi:pimeloyl-ACP methyl ester carboxylesterase
MDHNLYYEKGQGHPIVVLTGGPGLSNRLYRRYLDPLTKSYRVIFGGQNGKSFAQDYRNLLELIEHLKLKKIILLAHSYGGCIAQKFAIENKDLLGALILVSTAPAFAPVLHGAFERKKSRLSDSELKDLIAVATRVQSHTFNDQDGKLFCNLDSKCQFLNPTSAQTKIFEEEADFDLNIFSQNQDWVSLDFKSQLSEIIAPTLIVTSKNDVVVPQQFSSLLKNIPNSTEVEFLNSSHWPFAEEPELFFKQVLAFLSDHCRFS